MLATDWTRRRAAFLIASICFVSASSAIYWSFHSGITEKKNRFSNFILEWHGTCSPKGLTVFSSILSAPPVRSRLFCYLWVPCSDTFVYRSMNSSILLPEQMASPKRSKRSSEALDAKWSTMQAYFLSCTQFFAWIENTYTIDLCTDLLMSTWTWSRPQIAIATAQTLFHRFFCTQSFAENNVEVHS